MPKDSELLEFSITMCLSFWHLTPSCVRNAPPLPFLSPRTAAFVADDLLDQRKQLMTLFLLPLLLTDPQPSGNPLLIHRLSVD
jgi:hypothetical protein